MTLVLDSGALIALEHDDRNTWRLVWEATVQGEDAVTSAAAVAQVWRGGARQARLAQALTGIEEIPLTSRDGRVLGAVLGDAGTSDVVDAHVALLAEYGDVVLTSDPGDIRRLLDARGVRARVVAV